MSNVFTSDSKRSVRKFGNREVEYDRDEMYLNGRRGDNAFSSSWRGEGGYHSSWWALWTGIVVFIILGLGFWIIKPNWVLAKDLTGAIELPLTIDWLRLLVTDLIVTLILLFVAWLIKWLANGAFSGSCW